MQAAIDGVKGLLKEKGENDSTNVPEEINEFRKEFDDLLELAEAETRLELIDHGRSIDHGIGQALQDLIEMGI